MKAWTDYPFACLGDAPGEEAPIRQIEVLSYDGDKYCKIEVDVWIEYIKAGYIYQKPGRCGEVPCLSSAQLKNLSMTDADRLAALEAEVADKDKRIAGLIQEVSRLQNLLYKWDLPVLEVDGEAE